MRTLIFSLLLASTCVAWPGRGGKGHHPLIKNWGKAQLTEDEYAKKYNEKFQDKDLEKEAARFLEIAEKEIYEQHQKFEKGEANFDDSLHEYDDMDPKEWNKISEGFNMDDASREEYFHGLIYDPNAKNTPEELERLEEIYKDLERVDVSKPYDSPYQSPVQHQGACGSCAAFATAGGIESCFLKAVGSSISGLNIAEQQLLDCAYSPPYANGCEGASLDIYANYATKNKMIHENTYPYTSGSTRNVGKCKTLAYWNPGAKVAEKIVHHGPTDEQIKKLVKTYGHAIVAMYAGSPKENSFKHYKTGVYDGCRGQKPNHLVVITGWGKEKGLDYWKIKNSWGKGWGDAGYAKVKMGTCRLNTGAVSLRCQKNGSSDTVPEDSKPKPPKPCDMNYAYPDTSGTHTLKIRGPLDGKMYTVKVACQHGFCTPQPFTEKTNSCKVLCGADPCNQPPACNWPWIGDGWCDQVNMKAACKFDGGDCKN